MNITDIDFVTKAPDGKEVEELTKKEIHKALRSRVSPEQLKIDFARDDRMNNDNYGKQQPQKQEQKFEKKPFQAPQPSQKPAVPQFRPAPQPVSPQPMLSQAQPTQAPQATIVKRPQAKPTPEEKKKFGKLLEDLIGTRGAYVLDDKLNIMGKVPLSELPTTIKSLGSGIYAVIFDGDLDQELLNIADKSAVKFVVSMGAKSKGNTSVCVLTVEDF